MGAPLKKLSHVAAASTTLVISAVTASAAPSRPAAKSRDGFFLRMGAGAAYFLESRLLSGDPVTSDAPGAALTFELGGTPDRGLLVGGALSLGIFPGVEYPDSASSTQGSSGNRTETLITVGPLGELYPNPSGGLYFGAALGFAELVAAGGSQVGFFVTPHVGFEGWVADQWSIGARLGATIATVETLVTEEDMPTARTSSGASEERHLPIVPALSVVATFQ